MIFDLHLFNGIITLNISASLLSIILIVLFFMTAFINVSMFYMGIYFKDSREVRNVRKEIEPHYLEIIRNKDIKLEQLEKHIQSQERQMEELQVFKNTMEAGYRNYKAKGE